MRWSDTAEIAIELAEAYPDAKPLETRFTDLHRMVCGLADFADDPNRSSEGILEAILTAWIEECG